MNVRNEKEWLRLKGVGLSYSDACERCNNRRESYVGSEKELRKDERYQSGYFRAEILK
ncbi:MAG: hypothetical protein KIH01_04075 [Candidatus Freyarchaeota archaeon]|nr:hypothetical protein [Candidatus Jordarchaeia archaeon]